MEADKKVALCLHGYFNSKTDGSSLGEDGFEHLKKNVLSRADVDVYIHSWEPELCEMINGLYKPKSFLYQPQIDFSRMVKHRGLDVSLPEACPPMRRTPETILSHFYSIQKSFELCYQSDIEYDIVIKARFDTGRINRDPNTTPVQCISFDPTLDMSTMKMADWGMFDQGPADMWFYSSHENMRHFTEIFDLLSREFFIDSQFHQWVQLETPLGFNDLSNAVAFYHWWFRDKGLWDNKDALKCEFE